jgi:hypothetical protein
MSTKCLFPNSSATWDGFIDLSRSRITSASKGFRNIDWRPLAQDERRPIACLFPATRWTHWLNVTMDSPPRL